MTERKKRFLTALSTCTLLRSSCVGIYAAVPAARVWVLTSEGALTLDVCPALDEFSGDHLEDFVYSYYFPTKLVTPSRGRKSSQEFKPWSSLALIS